MPTAGTISIAGVETDRDRFHAPPRDRNIGMVFQGFALWPHMRVRENIAFPLNQRGMSGGDVIKKTNAVLDLVGLSSRANHYPGQLSGGQQQRVALARALVAEPKVILYDEPLSSLDTKLREQIRGEIRDLHKRLNITAVYVTHDQEEATDISDVIYVMRDGKIVQGGQPTDLSDRPKDLFVCGFFGHANVFKITDYYPRGDSLLDLATEEGLKLKALQTIDHAGRPSYVAIRPHRIDVDQKYTRSDDIKNMFSGVISQVRQYGTRYAYVVKINEKCLLDVENLRRGNAFKVGDEVTVSFSASDCMLLN